MLCEGRDDASGARHIRNDEPQYVPRTWRSQLGFFFGQDVLIRERFAVQFRGGFFNILNHPNFTNPYGVGGQLGNVNPSNPSSFGYSERNTGGSGCKPGDGVWRESCHSAWIEVQILIGIRRRNSQGRAAYSTRPFFTAPFSSCN